MTVILPLEPQTEAKLIRILSRDSHGAGAPEKKFPMPFTAREWSAQCAPLRRRRGSEMRYLHRFKDWSAGACFRVFIPQGAGGHAWFIDRTIADLTPSIRPWLGRLIPHHYLRRNNQTS